MATVRMSNNPLISVKSMRKLSNTNQNQSTLRLLAMLSMIFMSNLLLTEPQKHQGR